MFNYLLQIPNALQHYGQYHSPLHSAHGRKDDFKNLKTFGCRIRIQQPGVCNKRFHQDARQGIFLSYVPHTDKLFVWYDENSERVKIAIHAKFDEGFNDLPIDNLPPNCQHNF